VVDIWGDPVQGAVVKMDGVGERPTTDANGRFELPFRVGTHTLKAGREGYIQRDLQVTLPETAAEADEVVFQLYPIPDETGFHVVASDGYQKLEPRPIHAVGNNIRSLYGLRESDGPSVDGSALRFVYHGPLSRQQLAALDISLHKLEFVADAEMIGITTQQVPLNLHVSAGEIPLALTRLNSRNDYLLETEGPLERGARYALTTNDLLDPPDDEHFRRVAPTLRLAFPVEVR